MHNQKQASIFADYYTTIYQLTSKYLNKMVTSKKILLMFVYIISCSIYATAQKDFYYYKGEKISLTLNENKVVINIPKTYDEASERIRTNVQVLNTIADEAFDILVISRSDFEKLASLDFWEEDATSVILTSSYYTEDNEEVFSTPYLNVKLKKEQDIDILNSYAEEYGLRIVKNMPSMPLWYILALTLDTKKNTLECANELYETGYFAASVPDLYFDESFDETTIQRIIPTKTKESLGIYDLSGRRVVNPKRGLYIQGGKKVVKQK